MENQRKIKECIFHPKVLHEIDLIINNTLQEEHLQDEQKFRECQFFDEQKILDSYLTKQFSILGYQNITRRHVGNLLKSHEEVSISKPIINEIEGAVTSGVTRSENVLNLLAKMYIEPFRKTILRFFLSNRESHQSVFPMTSIQNFEQANTHTPHTELELEKVNAFTENLQILHIELNVMINRALAIHENNKSGLTRKINESHSNILNDNSLRPIPFLFKNSVVNQQNLEFDFGFYPRFFKFPSSVLSLESINVNEKFKNIYYKNKTL